MGRRPRSDPIVIVDNNPRVRSLVSALLRREGHPTVGVSTAEEALRALEEYPAQLVILDVDLPGVSGYELCHELRQTYGEQLPIIFLSETRNEARDRVAGFLVGADDYIGKPFAPDELLVRIRRLIRQTVLSTSAADRPLTPREVTVLRLLAEGLDQVEIAKRLGISSKTSATHIEHILGKLSVHSRAQAVAYAYRSRILDEPPVLAGRPLPGRSGLSRLTPRAPPREP